jgi:hypothetical protein
MVDARPGTRTSPRSRTRVRQEAEDNYLRQSCANIRLRTLIPRRVTRRGGRLQPPTLQGTGFCEAKSSFVVIRSLWSS